jgi:hypothetical protein
MNENKVQAAYYAAKASQEDARWYVQSLALRLLLSREEKQILDWRLSIQSFGDLDND